MRVKVYFNLHKKVFSVMDKKTRKVIAHTDTIILKNAKFTVSKSGRERVLREKKKNVHAFVEGDWKKDQELFLKRNTVRYNPYEADYFINVLTGKKIETSAWCDLFIENGKANIYAY